MLYLAERDREIDPMDNYTGLNKDGVKAVFKIKSANPNTPNDHWLLQLDAKGLNEVEKYIGESLTDGERSAIAAARKDLQGGPA